MLCKARVGFCVCVFNGSHPAPFVEKLIRSSLNYVGAFVEIIWPYTCGLFLDFIPLIYMSVLTPVLDCLEGFMFCVVFLLYYESLS